MADPLDHGVCCPRCGYNLTGVVGPRSPQGVCPECGGPCDYWVIRGEGLGIRKRWLVASLLVMPLFWAWAFPMGCCCSGLGALRFDGSGWWAVAGGGLPVVTLSVLHGRHLARSVAAWRRVHGLGPVWWAGWGCIAAAEVLLSGVYLATAGGCLVLGLGSHFWPNL